MSVPALAGVREEQRGRDRAGERKKANGSENRRKGDDRRTRCRASYRER